MHLVPKMWTIETKLNVGWMSSYVKERQLQFAAEFKVWQRLLLRPGQLKCTYGRSGKFPVGEINSSQTATMVVVKQSLGSWSHL